MVEGLGLYLDVRVQAIEMRSNLQFYANSVQRSRGAVEVELFPVLWKLNQAPTF